MTPEAALLARMVEFGLHPPAIHFDGKIHRFRTEGERGNHRSGAGWYRAFQDRRGAVFGCWRTGVEETWQDSTHRPEDDRFDPEELRRSWEAQRREREAELAREHAEVAEGARRRWKASPDASADHPYLVKKKIGPEGLKQEGDLLLVPVKDVETNELVNLQTIGPDGEKLFLKGGRVKGCGSSVGGHASKEVIFICEGEATSKTVHAVAGAPAKVALTAHNLATNAVAMRKKYPDAVLVVGADNDKWSATPKGRNPGVLAAREAARAASAEVAIPSFTTGCQDPACKKDCGKAHPTDFNDLLLLEGEDAVRRWLEPELAGQAVTWTSPPAGPTDEAAQATTARDVRGSPLDDAPPADRASGELTIDAILDATGLAKLGDEPDAVELEASLDMLAGLYTELPPLRQALLREAACKALKAAGISSPAKVVDAAIGAAEEEEEGRQGRKLVLEDVEPWDEAVDGPALLEELVRTSARFLALPEGAPTALALWTVHTHAHDAAAVSPILGVTSPEKRCGKSTLLHVESGLVPRPLPASNITPAAIYRAIETHRPTMLIDEADTFFEEREDLRGLLNSGHARASAVIVRCAEPDWEPRLFSTWAPKAVALIGDLPSTIEDRSILIRMRRRAPDETVERLRLDRLADLDPIRRRIARWARDNMRALAVMDPDVPPELHDRAADNWRPLLAIADRAGGVWPERARRAARLLTGVEAAEDASVQVMLLADLRDIFRDEGRDRLSSQDITEALAKMEHRPWPEWKKGKPISARGLARLLKPFKVKPKAMDWGGSASKGVRGYALEDFQDAFSRYLPPSDPQPPQPSNNGAGFHDFPIRNQEEQVAHGESGENPTGTTKVAVVALGKGGSDGESPDSEVPNLWATVPEEVEVADD